MTETAPAYNEYRTADKITGVEESVFYIERPAGALTEVNASSFGASPENEDNFPAFEQAFLYCSEHPGTKLVIDSGVYYLDNARSLELRDTENIFIEGTGARLIFSQVRTAIVISGCDCVEFHGLEFDWNWDKLPLSDIVTVRAASPKDHSLEFVFPECADVDENMIIAAVSQCDPDTFTYGAKHSNKEVYVYMDADNIRSVEKTESNVLKIVHNGCMDHFSDGDMFILRHYVYDASFAVLNGASKNITVDDVSLFGYPGAGFIVGEKTSHFQIINSYIGVEPSRKNDRHTSLGADAIHIVNSDGCFLISGCDISGQGDDALNVHDGLGWVKSVNGNHIELTGNAMYLRIGDVLHFRDASFNDTDSNAAITALTYHADGTYYDIEFDRDVSSLIKPGYIANNKSCCSDNYVVRDNYIHENRARGFLLQSSDGLCENNRFYKTEMQAIKVIMDISPGLWYEGTGVDRLVIRNNEFEYCDYMASGEVITVGSNIAGKTAEAEAFTNVSITGNTFTEFPSRVLNADNVNGFVFSGNKIDAGTVMPLKKAEAKAYFGRYCSNVDLSDNEWINCPLGGIAGAASVKVWMRTNSSGPVC